MALGSRQILFLVLGAVFAVFVSVAEPAEGLILDGPVRQTKEATTSDNAAVAIKGLSDPPKLGVECSCEKVACSCQATVSANIMGNQIEFDPKINVEFVDVDMAIGISVTDRGQTLVSHEISGKEMVPPICIPIPQFPVVVFCLEFHDLSCSLEKKTVSMCTALSINTTPVPLQPRPSLPVGCFTAGGSEVLKYSPPEFKYPNKEHVDALINNIQKQLEQPFFKTDQIGLNKKDNVEGKQAGNNQITYGDKPPVGVDFSVKADA